MTKDGKRKNDEVHAELVRDVERLERHVDRLLRAVPFGVALLFPDGTSRVSESSAAMLGYQGVADAPGAFDPRFTFFRADRVTPLPRHELPGMRAMAGQRSATEHVWVVGPNGKGVLCEAHALPMPGGGAILLVRDVTARHDLERELASRHAALEERDAQNRTLIERLRLALDALSTPVLEVDRGVLVVPIVGVVDSPRAAQISERVLDEVVRQQARWVVIDATGVAVVDTATAAALARIVQAVELLGARCVASGLTPTVVQTMVELGVDLARLETHQTVRQALVRCTTRKEAA